MSDTEPKRYAWMRDGLLVAGTLAEYAHMWEGDYYSGDVDLTNTLLFWDGRNTPEICPVIVRRGQPTETDYIPYEIRCNADTAWVSIDGRA